MNKIKTWAPVCYLYSDGRTNPSIPAHHLEKGDAERIKKAWGNFLPKSVLRIRRSALGGYSVEKLGGMMSEIIGAKKMPLWWNFQAFFYGIKWKAIFWWRKVKWNLWRMR